MVGLGAQRGTTADADPGLVAQVSQVLEGQGQGQVQGQGQGGERLVRMALSAVAGSLPTRPDDPLSPKTTVSRSSIGSFADLLYTIVDAYPNSFREWAYPLISFSFLFV